MLSKAQTLLHGYTLHALNGEIGTVKDFYFDDNFWTIRYLVADTGSWLSSRQVLISPYALARVNKEELSISVNLTKEQIESSPSLDTDMPVSRQFEDSYHKYFGWPAYWCGAEMWGYYPNLLRDREEQWPESTRPHNAQNPDLRSIRNVKGYHIEATDGDIGHVDDFIIEDANWAIRYLVVDTHNWLPGKKILVSPKWIDHVSWAKSIVAVNLARDVIKKSPEYTDDYPISVEYEANLHRYYNRQAEQLPNIKKEDYKEPRKSSHR